MFWSRFISFFSPTTAGAVNLKGKSILLIDDGETERKAYPPILEKAGCQVKTAADARSGLALALSDHFDLILLDYMLPDQNGIEVCKELKRNKMTKSVPVVFLTGSVKPESVINCYDVGADCYLSKPISSDALLKQVGLTLQEASPA